ncbi:MAG: tetratricopeptide repeat protein [Syntrophorhabdaceae bacterium]|nr:tetratricopeptide repeat protein [Syntrophorhabdaceae bacterium]
MTETAAGGSRTRYALVPLVAVILAYLNSFQGVFQLDDYNVIVFNPAVHSWFAFGQDWFHGIRPLLKLTYTLNWTSPTGVFTFHAFNLAVHLASVFLVFSLTFSLLRDRPGMVPEKALYPAACLTALLFGLHPIQTEAVTYITGRSASLMTMFYLGSLAAYVKGTRENGLIRLYILSPLLFLLAVATKETGITLPFSLVLYEVCAGQGTGVKKALKSQSVHWAVFAVLLGVVLVHPRYRLFLLYSFDLRGFQENLLGQIKGAGDLLSHLIIPGRLNIDPGAFTSAGWLSPQSLLLALLVALAVVGLWKRLAWLSFGIGWFFLHVMVVNVMVPRIDSISDRHFYQAGWGILLVVSVAMTWLVFRLRGGVRAFAALGLCLAIVLGGCTVARNRAYHSEIALWEDTVLKSPQNPRAFNNLGYAYYLEGRKEEARDAYRCALQIDPAFERARNNLKVLDGE